MGAFIPDERCFGLAHFTVFLLMKTEQVITGTSAATFKVMEPGLDNQDRGDPTNTRWPIRDRKHPPQLRDMMTNKPGCNGPKAFLTGCVPDLEFDGLAVQLDRSDLEVDADGRNVALGVGVIGETEQEARFADAGISDQE